MSPVTVLGLGFMGTALADTFTRAGHTTTVWNRTPGKSVPGTTSAPSAAAAVSASPLVVVCLTTYTAVEAVLTPLAAELAGRTLVNLTSGTPDEAQNMAAWAAAHGIGYLDGAIMAVPPQLGGPSTLLLYSGAPFGDHQATLEVLGGGTTHLGADPALAAVYDMALLTLLYTTYTGYLHALALAGAAGVPGSAFLPHAQAWTSELLVPLLPEVTRLVDARDYSTDVSTLLTNQAGVAHIVAGSTALGVDPALLLPIQRMLDQRVADGHGTDGLPSLIETILVS